MEIKIISVDSVMLYFEQTISEEVLDEVQHAYGILKGSRGIIDITPSYCSILIRYDITLYTHQTIQTTILDRLSSLRRLIQIPTRYGGEDLERVARLNNLTIEEVITLHTQTTYRVYAIGFMVGFAYLAKVDPKIITPRLSTPRAKVRRGSVAIADNQTAIYPQDSAGGWNIIGETTFDDFERFGIGDTVEFVRI